MFFNRVIVFWPSRKCNIQFRTNWSSGNFSTYLNKIMFLILLNYVLFTLTILLPGCMMESCKVVYSGFDTNLFSLGVNSSTHLALNNKEYSPKRFFMFTRKLFTWSDRNFCAISLLEIVSNWLVLKRLCIKMNELQFKLLRLWMKSYNN